MPLARDLADICDEVQKKTGIRISDPARHLLWLTLEALVQDPTDASPETVMDAAGRTARLRELQAMIIGQKGNLHDRLEAVARSLRRDKRSRLTYFDMWNAIEDWKRQHRTSFDGLMLCWSPEGPAH